MSRYFDRRVFNIAAVVAVVLLAAWLLGYLVGGYLHELAIEQSLRGKL